jgi:hypothetical protein
MLEHVGQIGVQRVAPLGAAATIQLNFDRMSWEISKNVCRLGDALISRPLDLLIILPSVERDSTSASSTGCESDLRTRGPDRCALNDHVGVEEFFAST